MDEAIICSDRLLSADLGSQLLGINDLLEISRLPKDQRAICYKHFNRQPQVVAALVGLVRANLESDSLRDILKALAVHIEFAKNDVRYQFVQEGFLSLAPKLIAGQQYSMDMKLDCMRAVRYLAFNDASRNEITSLSPLFPALQSYSKVMFELDDVIHMRNFAETIFQVIQGGGRRVNEHEVFTFCLRIVTKLLFIEDIDILVPSLNTLQYCTEKRVELFNDIFALGLWPRILELLIHSSIKVQAVALRCFGNAATGDDIITQLVIDWNGLPILRLLLESSRNQKIKKEACWTLSNIAAGTETQLQALLAANVLPTIVDIARNGNENDVLKEAAWVLGNIIDSANIFIILRHVDQPFLEALVKLLENPLTATVNVSLEAANKILNAANRYSIEERDNYCRMFEAVGMRTRIEALTAHSLENISSNALLILETYFATDEEA